MVFFLERRGIHIQMEIASVNNVGNCLERLKVGIFARFPLPTWGWHTTSDSCRLFTSKNAAADPCALRRGASESRDGTPVSFYRARTLTPHRVLQAMSAYLTTLSPGRSYDSLRFIKLPGISRQVVHLC